MENMDSLQDSTFDLNQAAKFLHMSPAVLRQRACLGQVKGAKPGKRWVFLRSDLVLYLQSLYPTQVQAPYGDKEGIPCHFINAATSGGSNLRPPTDSTYADLLKRPKDDLLKNFTTN